MPKYSAYFLKVISYNFYQEVAHALNVKTAGSAVPRPNAVVKMKRKRLLKKCFLLFFKFRYFSFFENNIF